MAPVFSFDTSRCLCLTIHATLRLYIHVQMMTELLHFHIIDVTSMCAHSPLSGSSVNSRALGHGAETRQTWQRSVAESACPC